MSVRRMLASDIPGCAALLAETFAAPPWNEQWTVADAQRRLDDMLATPGSEGRVLVEPEQVLVGFVLGHRQRFQAADHFFLQEMCVRPTHQGKGRGTALLASLHEDLADIRVWSLLTDRQSPAAAFYRRLGYRPAERMGFFVRP